MFLGLIVSVTDGGMAFVSIMKVAIFLFWLGLAFLGIHLISFVFLFIHNLQNV